MQKRLSATATMVGINGDFYAPDTGRPSGVLMRDGVVDSPPSGDRSSVGLSPEGSIDIRRVEFFGTWRGLGQRRTLTDMNQAPKQNAISLFTPSYGATTPAQAGVSEIVLQPFPPAVPNTDLTGTVVAFSGVGGTPIPRDGAVLVARGTAAQRLQEEAPIGSTVTIRMILRPDWIGNPQRRRRRTRDRSRRRPGLPRQRGLLVLPARAAPSADRNRPARRRADPDGRRRRPPAGLQRRHDELRARAGARSPRRRERIGPGRRRILGDGLRRLPAEPPLERRAGDVDRASAHVLRRLRADSRSVHLAERRRRRRAAARALVQGRPPVERDCDACRSGRRNCLHRDCRARSPARIRSPSRRAPLDPTLPPAPPAEGRWRLDVSATDDLGQTSTTSQSFTVNSTLGFAKLSRRSLVVRVRGKQTIQAGVTLTRPARVLATVETVSGVRVASIALRRLEAGRFVARWKGTTLGGRSFVYGGLYKIRFRATNELGVVELTTQAFRVIRAAPLPPKKPKPPASSG